MQSMTGFGAGRSEGEGWLAEAELRSVNHRFLDIVIRGPRVAPALEEEARKQIRGVIFRGHVTVSLNCREISGKRNLIALDKDLALAYDKCLRDLAQELRVVYQPDLWRLVSLPDVWRAEETADAQPPPALVAEALTQALAALVAARAAEGASIARDLRARLALIRNYALSVRERAPAVAEAYRARLGERMTELMGGGADQRLAAEAALFADKADITEETVRLLSHADQFETALAAAEPVGRRLDFLLQEIGREVNTIGSKANDALITRVVVDGKCELEKMREQVQNLE
ncbi:MAG: YicC family protein [Gracilibacteraceae bacterium]|nr:YicC family protein [Gracilibacteraceae bacterium]